jgi:alkylation response protein AidB-like acyl-CoA dehydrogenase
VTTPKGFKEAYASTSKAAGRRCPATRSTAARACPSWSTSAVRDAQQRQPGLDHVPGLSHGAYEALHAHGTEQKKTYLPKLTSGEWTGTMCLTEPHCGTDLGLLRTKAEPQADGSYKITGNKIFISAGEHDMAENIVHLVLARLPDAPAGSRASACSWCPSSR